MPIKDPVKRKEYQQKWHSAKRQRNDHQKETHRLWMANWRNNKKEWFQEIKQDLKCKKCGETRWWVLDFHHTNPTEKDKPISQMIYHCSKKLILEEIKKCDVLCANCHRDYHYQINQEG